MKGDTMSTAKDQTPTAGAPAAEAKASTNVAAKLDAELFAAVEDFRWNNRLSKAEVVTLALRKLVGA